jgi:transcriptional regulator with XRE-family HTH domain
MSDETDMVLSEFIDAWNAGRRPRVDDYLDRVAPGEREELGEQIETWVLMAPSPDYSEDALAQISAEPALAGALAEIAAQPELWPEVLPRLRERAGLRLRDLATRVTAAFGLSGQESRTESYLGQLERGELDATRVSRRLLEALGKALGANLLSAGARSEAAEPGLALFRAEEEAGASFEEELEILSRAALTPAPEPMDELDRLFLGGPDG